VRNIASANGDHKHGRLAAASLLRSCCCTVRVNGAHQRPTECGAHAGAEALRCAGVHVVVEHEGDGLEGRDGLGVGLGSAWVGIGRLGLGWELVRGWRAAATQLLL